MVLWISARNLFEDKEIIGFKGSHVYKLRITYKAEGDSFQYNTICDSGHTFDFFFRNDPAPKKYLDDRLSPLYAHCMAVFDCFVNKYLPIPFNDRYMVYIFVM